MSQTAHAAGPPFWMTKTAHVRLKTAHTQVQNGPSADRKYQSRPKLKRNFKIETIFYQFYEFWLLGMRRNEF